MDEDMSTPPLPALKRLPPEDGPVYSDQPKRVKLPAMNDHENTGTSEINAVVDSTKPKKDKNISRRRDAAGYAKSRKGKEKDGKNTGRRRGTRQDDPISAGQISLQSEDLAPKAPRLPKRQCALLIGFCGTGCNGMQMWVQGCILMIGSDSIASACINLPYSQRDVRTIEGVLFEAMVKAGAVSQDNANDPSKVHSSDLVHVACDINIDASSRSIWAVQLERMPAYMLLAILYLSR